MSTVITKTQLLWTFCIVNVLSSVSRKCDVEQSLKEGAKQIQSC